MTSPPKLPLLRRSTTPYRQHPFQHHRRRRRRLALARVRSAHHTRRRQTMAEERTQVSGDHSELQHLPSATTTVVVVMLMMGAHGVQGLSLCLPLLAQPLLTSALCESWLRVLLGSKEEEHRSRVGRCDVEGAWQKRVWPARSSHDESSMCRSSSSRPNLNLKRCQTHSLQTHSLRCTRSQEPSKASERPARPRAHLTDCWGSPKMPLLCHPLRRVSLLGHCPSPRQHDVLVEHQQRSFSRVRKSCCTST